MNILITGVTGQDGFYLAELLLRRGDTVFGTSRRSKDFDPELVALAQKYHRTFQLVACDPAVDSDVRRAFMVSSPDRVYHFAGLSHVGQSFARPQATYQAVLQSGLNVLEAALDYSPRPRVYLASSSEMFGNVGTALGPNTTLDVATPKHPVSPYGLAKLAVHEAGGTARERGLHVVSGIAFNHESTRRPASFVTRAISAQVAEVARGQRERVLLGNLDAERDWGWAPEYVEGMRLLLERDEPEDAVLATGVTASVGEFAAHALECAGLDPSLVIGQDVTPDRPIELTRLCARTYIMEALTSWKPVLTWKDVAAKMVEYDLRGGTR